MNNWSSVECIFTEQKLINYTPYLYLHFIFTLCILFIFTLSTAIYSLYYLYFPLYLSISIFYILFILFVYFFCRTVFLTHCVSQFVDKRLILSLLLHNLPFSCPRSLDDDPIRDCITHEIKVYAYNNNNITTTNNSNLEEVFSLDGLGIGFGSICICLYIIVCNYVYNCIFKEENLASYKIELYLQFKFHGKKISAAFVNFCFRSLYLSLINCGK